MMHQQQPQQHQQAHPSSNVSDVPSSVEPDAPPSGTGGSRKRPKYTRSKKGCLTCRSKKIKCDERKPICTRCEHGHRECTWPEAVLPRRPKGAVRGVGDEDDAEEDERRQSIPGSAVSTQFPSSATSTHFNGIPSNSPFEPAPPRRDAFESDVYPNGSQFSMPVVPANARPLYPRGPGSTDFYPVTTINGQPIDDYEFPPRQAFGAGSSSGSRSSYSNGALYATGPPGAVSSYNNDLRRASWDSSAPTDGRRLSGDANSMGAHASSVSSPASSILGLGLGISRVGGSSTSNNAGAGGSGAQGGSNGGLMLFQSPDPLSPFFRSVQERNLVGNISSFAPSSTSFPFTSSPFSSSPSSSASSYYSQVSMVSSASYDASTIPVAQNLSASPVLSNASCSDFGVTPEGVAYRKNSFPHLFALPQPLTIDPPVPIVSQGVDLGRPSIDLLSLAEKSGQSEGVEWIAPPSSEICRPISPHGAEEFESWNAYS